MTTNTTHITKDQSEARKAEVPETEALKPCPFCGGKCDPEGWIGDKKRSGPACDDCGSAAETVAIWNTRAAELSAQESKPVAWQFQDDHGDWQECSQETYEGLMAVKARERTRALYESPSVSAQDASPKDGWQIEIVPDPPYPQIVRVRSPEGVARVLTEGDGVLYRYFHKVALAALEVPK